MVVKTSTRFCQHKSLPVNSQLTHLNRLHGAEGDVGKELGRGGGCEVQRGPVQVGVLLAQDARVDVLEHLVEAELAETLKKERTRDNFD